LLLDEPTNHLDLDALVWLEAWLQRYAGTLIVISHDREFLDAVTDVTVHIERQQLTRYGGNYSAFETLRAQQLELQQAAYSKQREKIAHLQKFIDRFKAKATKAKQAESRVKALGRMEKIAPVLADAEFTFEFKEPANLPNPMLAIRDAEFGYQPSPPPSPASGRGSKSDPREAGYSLPLPPGEGGGEGREPKVILRNVSKSVLAGERIGILGANGQGKSTLVKTIARAIPPLGGTVTEGKGLNIGYFAQQELDVLRPQDTPLEHMTRLARERGPNSGESGREQDLRNFLGTFNFSGDMVAQTVGTMSGGEKARLVLAMIVWQRPNLLLLDEPTNHLDLATREALAMALNEFEGTVMLVSPRPGAAAGRLRRVLAGGARPRAAFRRRPGRLPALPAGRVAAPARGGAAGSQGRRARAGRHGASGRTGGGAARAGALAAGAAATGRPAAPAAGAAHQAPQARTGAGGAAHGAAQWHQGGARGATGRPAAAGRDRGRGQAPEVRQR
jgi:ATP-binding cassette subfamily F protein 3